MKNDYRKLVTDTLTLLKEEGHALSRKKTFAPPPPQRKPKPVVIKQETVEKPKPLPPRPTQKKGDEGPVFTLIKKHLPHVRLMETIPSAQKAAILVFDREDLPFLKNLAKAIQDNLCPVSLLDGTKIEWDPAPYSLVIAQENGAIDADIFLKPASFYEENPTEKKQLWTKLCTHLSQKSS